MPEAVHPLKLTSLLLQYPEPEVVRGVGEVEIGQVSPASAAQREALEAFLGWYRGRSLDRLRQAYVDSFDFDRQRTLHLTYQLHGDSRQRGLALLKIKTAYREAGLDPDEGELPDYLPLMLEFASLTSGSAGIELLDRHRPSIELVRESLKRIESPWVHLLDVVREALPGLTRRQITRIKRLAEQGPPTEQVGMEPFAPPEVMPARPGDVPQPLIGGRG